MLSPVLKISPKKYNGETTIVSMRMSKELLKDIDQVAELTGYKRNDILIMSLEFAINHMEIVDNPYFKQRRGIKYHVMGILYGLTDKSFLREFGKKLPGPLQKIIRKVFL